MSYIGALIFLVSTLHTDCPYLFVGFVNCMFVGNMEFHVVLVQKPFVLLFQQ